MVKVATRIPKVPFSPVITRTIFNLVKELKRGQMVQSTKATMRMARSMVMVYIAGVMEHTLKVIGSKAP